MDKMRVICNLIPDKHFFSQSQLKNATNERKSIGASMSAIPERSPVTFRSGVLCRDSLAPDHDRGLGSVKLPSLVLTHRGVTSTRPLLQKHFAATITFVFRQKVLPFVRRERALVKTSDH